MNAAVSGLAFLVLAQIVIAKPDRPVSAPDAPLGLVEPHLAVSRDDENHLVAGAIAVSPDRDGPWRCVAFTSRDGGAVWQRHDFDIDRCIDPWVVVLPDGTALFTAIELDRDTEGDARFRLLSYRSSDGGRSWPQSPTLIGTRHEHQVLTLSGNVVWMASRRMRRTADNRPRHAIGLARSLDGGVSFEPISEIRPSNLALNVSGVSALDEERLVVTFIDFQRDVDGFAREGILEHARAWALVSTDGGRSFSEPLFVSEACGMKGQFPGYPFSTWDPTHRRLYFACVFAAPRWARDTSLERRRVSMERARSVSMADPLTSKRRCWR